MNTVALCCPVMCILSSAQCHTWQRYENGGTLLSCHCVGGCCLFSGPVHHMSNIGRGPKSATEGLIRVVLDTLSQVNFHKIPSFLIDLKWMPCHLCISTITSHGSISISRNRKRRKVEQSFRILEPFGEECNPYYTHFTRCLCRTNWVCELCVSLCDQKG